MLLRSRLNAGPYQQGASREIVHFLLTPDNPDFSMGTRNVKRGSNERPSSFIFRLCKRLYQTLKRHHVYVGLYISFCFALEGLKKKKIL